MLKDRTLNWARHYESTREDTEMTWRPRGRRARTQKRDTTDTTAETGTETETESTVEDQGRESIIETGETGPDRGQQVEKRDLGERGQFKGLDEAVMSAIAAAHLAGGKTTEMIDIDGTILTDEGN